MNDNLPLLFNYSYTCGVYMCMYFFPPVQLSRLISAFFLRRTQEVINQYLPPKGSCLCNQLYVYMYTALCTCTQYNVMYIQHALVMFISNFLTFVYTCMYIVCDVQLYNGKTGNNLLFLVSSHRGECGVLLYVCSADSTVQPSGAGPDGETT